ncbi:MAG: hypothetical protein AB8G95_11640 [Anaerolineae bacterium]
MVGKSPSKKRIYKPLPVIESREQVLEILSLGATEDLMRLPLALGLHCLESDKEFAQDICLQLANNDCYAVRANAVLGLAYIARNHNWLDKKLVKPYILRELRENEEFNWRIIDAIEDINRFLGWRLAKKHMSRLKES